MTVLSIDPGAKRIGLAKGDTELGIAFPFELVEIADETEGVRRIAEIVDREKVNHVLLGWPIGLATQETEQTAAVRRLHESLSETVSVPVERVDERMSTRRAAQNVGSGKSLDVEAARVLLEEWLSKSST